MSKKKSQNSPSIDTRSDMLARFQSMLSADQFQRMQAELTQPLFPSLRTNPFKLTGSSTENMQIWAEQYYWQFKSVPYCPDGFWVTASDLPISKTIEHSLGHYYIQDAASMLPPEMFSFTNTPDPLILDMAASPGGKTTHIASRSADRGLLIANDSSRDRLAALRIVLQNWGTTHTAISNYPGEYFGAWFPETFDAILLDAPCSMQGLRDTDSHPLKPITQKEINTLARRQSRLLASAIQALKVGGEVVYSTCTLTVEENEAVLDSILNKFGSVLQIEPASDLLPSPAPGLVQFDGQAYDPQVANSARIWPHIYGTAGFFAARIRKNEALASPHHQPPSRPLSQAGWHPLESATREAVVQFFSQTYDMPLESILQENRLEIWQHRDRLYLFPNQFIETFAGFPVQSLGLALAQQNAEDLVPTHEFFTRFGYQAATNRYFLDADQTRDWMRGQDLPAEKQSGVDCDYPILVDSNNRVLGTGKLSNQRLRNLLPNRARISGQMA